MKYADKHNDPPMSITSRNIQINHKTVAGTKSSWSPTRETQTSQEKRDQGKISQEKTTIELEMYVIVDLSY